MSAEGAPPSKSSVAATPPPKRAFRFALLVVLPFVVALGLVIAFAVREGRNRTIRIASGAPGGLANPVGHALAKAIAEREPNLRASAFETGGTIENAAVVERGDAELGIVHDDARGGASLRTLVPLYQEALQVVVRAGTKSLADLKGKRVASGPEGSGTSRLTDELLRHEGLVPDKDLVLVPGTHAEAAKRFAEKQVDAVFVLAGLPTPAVEVMLRLEGAELLSFGTKADEGMLDGFRLAFPHISEAVVPRHTYGSKPEAPCITIASEAVLVAKESLPDDVAQDITRVIFEARVTLVDQTPALARMNEKFDLSRLRFPVHAGATKYYTRDRTPFLLVWADFLSLLLSCTLLVGSGVLALGRWRRRRKKDRVDRYYLEVQELGDQVDAARSVEELEAAREGLKAIRRKAFAELAAERLAADESFTIFQDYLRSELLEVDAALRDAKLEAKQTAGDTVGG